MNRETLMRQIESKTGRSATEIDATLELVLQEIGSVLAGGESVSLGGYGVSVPRLDRTQRKEIPGVWRADSCQPRRKTVEFKPRKDVLAILNAKQDNKKTTS